MVLFINRQLPKLITQQYNYSCELLFTPEVSSLQQHLIAAIG
jgi:hypothetical protein